MRAHGSRASLRPPVACPLLHSQGAQLLLEPGDRPGLLLHGPNCMGVISFANRQAQYIGNIPADLPAGTVAAVCQSGSVAIGLMMSGRLGLSYLVSTGNEADVTLEEYLAYLIEERSVEVLLAFVEGFRRPDLFLAVADRARELGKPLVVLKIGRSAPSAAAALAHTGAQAGSAAAFDAVCRLKGVLRVRDLDELIETGVLCAALRQRPPAGAGVGTLTASGGMASPEVSDLFKWSARAWGVGALLSLPIFDGGRRDAAVESSIGEFDSAVASYREQVLVALREVEDELSALRLLAEQSQAQSRAVASAERATQLSTSRYRNGFVSQLELLDAQRSALRNRRLAVQVRGAQYESTVGLIRAMGGGWELGPGG